MKTDPCILYLVRHGETESNKNSITMGQLDAPLTALGVEQAEATGKELVGIHFDAVFASDLPRAIRTAQIIEGSRNLPVETSPLLRERNFGSFEGKSSEDFKTAMAKLREEKAIVSEEDRWHYSFGDGFESDEVLCSRFIAEVKKIAGDHQGKTVLIVAHGGPLRTFLVKVGWATHIKPGSFQNGGYIVAKSDGEDFVIDLVTGVHAPEGAE